ncbi:hypothetical protein [Paracoccus marcusii]|uniref:hypothetical protein n=1 Tax=Paracoccus marcusii TaxID=59779 RepID=UPI0032647B9E
MPIHAAKGADEHQDERPDAAKTCDLVGYLVSEGQAIVQRRLQLARQNRASLQTVEHGFVQGRQLARRVLQHALDVLPAKSRQIGLANDAATGSVWWLRLDQGGQSRAN